MHQRIAQHFRAPLDGLRQLLGGQLQRGAGGGVQDAAVLVRQPRRAPRQVNRRIGQTQRRYQLLGVVPDDDFAAVNDGNRGGQDAARFQIVARRRIGQQVMVLILNTVGRQKLLQRPAAESTRVGIDMDFADCRSHFALPRFQ